MTDRELLELAAKAAGIVGSYDDKLQTLWFDAPHKELGRHITWNPLTDDGDALRLAVMLGIDLKFPGPIVQAASAAMSHAVTEDAKDDPCAATRRAIVRAAAEIGRNIK